MVKWGAVIVGFILSIAFPAILGSLLSGWGVFLGLFLAGFVVGIMVKEGAMGGFWNASVAGAFGGIITAILVTIFGTIVAGLAGFALGLLTGSLLFLGVLIYSMLFMGIGGAIGGAISD